jgi:dTDP-4-amino-4,6-dideoxygalactose transaminase
MSQLTSHLLKGTRAQPLIDARQQNFNFLWKHLEEFCLFSDNTGEEAPFAMPLVVKNAPKILAFLHQRQIFAARHWKDLPSPSSQFPESHHLAQHLISLPCDHRYSLSHMKRLVSVFQEALETLGRVDK